mgnify:CR=1 FL=1
MAVAIINKRPILTEQRISVRSTSEDGELVVIRLGDGELGMHFEDALRFAALVRRKACAAMDRKVVLTGSAVGPDIGKLLR